MNGIRIYKTALQAVGVARFYWRVNLDTVGAGDDPQYLDTVNGLIKPPPGRVEFSGQVYFLNGWTSHFVTGYNPNLVVKIVKNPVFASNGALTFNPADVVAGIAGESALPTLGAPNYGTNCVVIPGAADICNDGDCYAVVVYPDLDARYVTGTTIDDNMAHTQIRVAW